jgi:long-subunit fatty acid transport protein
MNVTTELKRKDLDVSAGYLLSNYFKLIAGFKYTMASYNVDYEIGGSKYNFVDIDAKSYIPTVGIAFAYPILEKLIIGIQAGILYVISDYNDKTDNKKINTDNSWGINIEPIISYPVTDNILLQLGARYQIYSVKFTDSDLGVTKNDQFLGATFAVIYLW